jgi:hypothetical protein
MIAERPGAQQPSPDARWVEGYWDWDRNREDFAWVTGTWLAPPPGEFWVNGYWRRDAKGWYRVPGFWSGGGHVQKVAQVQEVALNGRTAGPSMTRPEELIGDPPGADYFYIPGEYVPAWGGVAWRPGYWVPFQPGWEWIPARWERRANAWVFHEGFWNRVRGTPIPPLGGLQPAGGTTLASAPGGSGSATARLDSNPVVPTNAAATPGETDPKATETTRSGQEAGKTTQNGASPKPGEPKPGEPKPGPQPVYPQQPPYAWYGPQPVYPPARALMWNARSAVGGFLRQVLP